MKLYNANFSPNCLRVRAVLAELGLDAEVVDLEFPAGLHTPEYLAVNPNGKVPTLVDDDVVLWESRAINRYLASKKPDRNLYPADAKTRAVVDQWSFWQAIHLGPAMQAVAFERVLKSSFGMGEADESAIEKHLKSVEQFLPVLDAGLDRRDWIAGDLSVADFALGSTFMFRDAAKISLGDLPQVNAWISRLEGRDSWQHAVAPLAAMSKG